MGTNYYVRDEAQNGPIAALGSQNRLHIGKSSAGWLFSLHVIPEYSLNSLDEWFQFLAQEGLVIENEYDDVIPISVLYDTITNRSRPNALTYEYDAAWFESNSAIPGPNNLARHAISEFCVGHGEGTWDYIIGEFS